MKNLSVIEGIKDYVEEKNAEIEDLLIDLLDYAKYMKIIYFVELVVI